MSAAITDSHTHREPELLDAVFECSGQQDAMDQALQILKPGGKLLRRLRGRAWAGGGARSRCLLPPAQHGRRRVAA